MTHIPVDGGPLDLIGDAICALPYLRSVVEREKAEGVVFYGGKFCRSVRPLLADWGWCWEDGPEPPGTHLLDMPLHQVFQFCNTVNRALHMCQGWYTLSQTPVPDLPIALPLAAEPVSPDYDGALVVSPFSRTDHRNNKLWPYYQWLQLIERIKGNRRVVIIGSAVDIWPLFQDKSYTLCIDEPLPKVLSILRSASLFLSIDNGMSHLAHFGGVGRHVLLAPACLPESFVRNPRGRHIYGNPLDISVDTMENVARW